MDNHFGFDGIRRRVVFGSSWHFGGLVVHSNIWIQSGLNSMEKGKQSHDPPHQVLAHCRDIHIEPLSFSPHCLHSPVLPVCVLIFNISAIDLSELLILQRGGFLLSCLLSCLILICSPQRSVSTLLLCCSQLPQMTYHLPWQTTFCSGSGIFSSSAISSILGSAHHWVNKWLNVSLQEKD
jgi:hypothetical protein